MQTLCEVFCTNKRRKKANVTYLSTTLAMVFSEVLKQEKIQKFHEVR